MSKLSPGIQAKFDMVWLGWPGADFNDAEKDIVANEAMKQGAISVLEVSVSDLQFRPQRLRRHIGLGVTINVLYIMQVRLLRLCNRVDLMMMMMMMAITMMMMMMMMMIMTTTRMPVQI